MGGMQCNVEFGYQLSICSGTKEKPRKTLVELVGRRTFRIQLTSSQQSGIECASPNVGPYLSVRYLRTLYILRPW
jgi:hypothetical protein